KYSSDAQVADVEDEGHDPHREHWPQVHLAGMDNPGAESDRVDDDPRRCGFELHGKRGAPIRKPCPCKQATNWDAQFHSRRPARQYQVETHLPFLLGHQRSANAWHEDLAPLHLAIHRLVVDIPLMLRDLVDQIL